MKREIKENNLPTAARLFTAFSSGLEVRREAAAQIATALKPLVDGHIVVYEDRECAGGAKSLLLFGEESGKTNATKQSWSLELCGTDCGGAWKSTVRVSVIGDCGEDVTDAVERIASDCRAEFERVSVSLGKPKFQAGAGYSLEMGMVVAGASTREVVELVKLYAREILPVLIRGESGTGKERIAQGLHDKSGRKGQKITINCGSVPAELIGSKLFGHTKGAFTGAHTAQKGAFEAADGGTLFLDEIGDMPLEQQVALLRVLQEGTITPIGSHTERRVNVRVVAATHCDIERLVEEGRFRRDLYYRLRGLTIEVKPLRARRDEIRMLAVHHVETMAAETGQASSITEEAICALEGHDWPGNVRELVMLLSQARIHARGGVIGVNELRLPVASAAQQAKTADDAEQPTTVVRQIAEARRDSAGRGASAPLLADAPQLPAEMGTATFDQQMQAYERLVIERTLERNGYNVKATADKLQLPHSTLRRKMLFLGIERPSDAPRHRRYQKLVERTGSVTRAQAAA